MTTQRVLVTAASAPAWRRLRGAAARAWVAGFEERREGRGGAVVAWAPSVADAERLAERLLEAFGAAAAEAVTVAITPESSAWRTEWTRHLRPVALTDHVQWAPVEAEESASAPGVTRLCFAPRFAFGDGSHVTTRLAARAVERLCRERPGLRVLDVGTGTGVLALVAVVSGAGGALGLDVDAEAVEAARDNARLNGLDARCQFAGTALAEVAERGAFDLVVANLELRPMREALGGILRAAGARGRVVLTGLLVDQAEEITRALRRANASVAPPRADEGWVLLETLA
ncbi:MAG: 50S ribosomal protein L11 methyltransferase [Polyangiaceae bacterium]|nr:50S ribosomal protein L11 methyltransferase [Polyangiaceae bacterium]